MESSQAKKFLKQGTALLSGQMCSNNPAETTLCSGWLEPHCCFMGGRGIWPCSSLEQPSI